MTEPKLRSHWRVEIPQRRPKDSAQVHQTLFLLEGGVWGRDYTALSASWVGLALCLARANARGMHSLGIGPARVGQGYLKLGWCKTWTVDSGLDCGLRFWTDALDFDDHFQSTSLGSTERRAVNLSLLLEYRVGEVSGVTEMENNRLTSL